MSDNKEEILFDDPEETELDELLDAETEKSHELEPIPESQARWMPSGALFNAELLSDSSRYCQDGVMVDQLSAETVDADSMNFLLAKQQQPLEPDENGPIPVGGSYRAPDYEELSQVLEEELACPFCSEPYTEQDCDPHDLGQLVSYGGTIYHWSCLALWMLVLAKGSPEAASKRFFVDIRDMKAIKSSYRAIPWGRLGFRVPGTHEVSKQ